MNKFYKIAFFPSISRDKFLSRAMRKFDASITTTSVKWNDMTITFASDHPTCGCEVEVKEGISIPDFTKRLECLLDCGQVGKEEEWVMKYCDSLEHLGKDMNTVAKLLCDRIHTIDSETGEIIGVMKLKRRSINKGHAKIRISEKEGIMQAVIRHTSPQGLKALWKSISWRLKPQYPSSKDTVEIKRKDKNEIKPCIAVSIGTDSYYAKERLKVVQLIALLSEECNLNDEKTYFYPVVKDDALELFGKSSFLKNPKQPEDPCCVYFARIKMKKISLFSSDIKQELNDELKRLVENKFLDIVEESYDVFHKKVTLVSEWLGLDWVKCLEQQVEKI